jgi:hypothetical protein
MIRFVVAVGGAVLLGGSASADDRCDHVKQAVATYGYAAARQHALENYGKEAVAFGDKCLRESGGREIVTANKRSPRPAVSKIEDRAQDAQQRPTDGR